MFASTPTAEQLADTLAHLLAGAAGGDETDWHEAIGEIEVLPIALHPRGNWGVAPVGSAEQRKAIIEAARLLAEAEPYALPLPIAASPPPLAAASHRAVSPAPRG